MEIKIDSLHIYPLKSAKGILLDQMTLLKTGPQWDREWMLVDAKNDFISQRKIKKMCLIEQRLDEKHLVLNAPGMDELKLALEHSSNEKLAVTLFNKTTNACLVGKIFDQWFSEFLGEPLRLVRSPAEVSRYTSGNHGPKTEILFPDGYPLLMTNQETLDELNSKLDQPALMNQFRPNIVVSGANANAEENWKSFKINTIEFDSVKACTRCSVISVDQNSGASNNDVVKTLLSYRKKDGQIIFGRNLIHKQLGTINVGDRVELL